MSGLPSVFTRPDLEALLAAAQAHYAARLPGVDATLRRGVLPVLPHVDAALAYDQHAHIDFTARQMNALFAVGADLDNIHGRFWGVDRRPASYAAGQVTFTGVDGAAILAGAALTGADGQAYTVTAGATVTSGSATVTVTADQAGAAGNRQAAALLTLSAAPAGVDPTGTVAAAGVTGGADVESDGAPGTSQGYRGRILEKIRQPPHGAAAFDYPAWAKTVPGVTDAWLFEKEQGLGTVTVRVMTYDATVDGIPSVGTLDAVAAVLEERRPPGIEVFVAAPAAVALDVAIENLDPDTPEIRAAIEAELAALIRRIAVPGATVFLSKIGEAISIARGEGSHTLTAPAANVTHSTGQIPKLGTVTYV